METFKTTSSFIGDSAILYDLLQKGFSLFSWAMCETYYEKKIFSVIFGNILGRLIFKRRFSDHFFLQWCSQLYCVRETYF